MDAGAARAMAKGVAVQHGIAVRWHVATIVGLLAIAALVQAIIISRAVVPALQAGLRLEPFPILLCWDQPFADFERYLPISPGLL